MKAVTFLLAGALAGSLGVNGYWLLRRPGAGGPPRIDPVKLGITETQRERIVCCGGCRAGQAEQERRVDESLERLREEMRKETPDGARVEALTREVVEESGAQIRECVRRILRTRQALRPEQIDELERMFSTH